MLPQKNLKTECFRLAENAPAASFNTDKSHGSKMTFSRTLLKINSAIVHLTVACF